MVGPLQGTAAQFSNKTPCYGATTWQTQQMNSYGQPANAFVLGENGHATNRTFTWQNWQSVIPTASGQQPNNFINENQHNSSLNAHNGQSCLSSGSFPVQNFQPPSSEFNNSSPPNTNVYATQDVSQLGTQRQTYVEQQPVAVRNYSLLEFYLLNQKRKVASNLNNQLEKPFPVQTTVSQPQEELKEYTSNLQLGNNRRDSQTLHQQGPSACAQQPPSYFSAIQAKNTIQKGTEYGVRQHIFQPSNVNQTSAQHQRQAGPAVNVTENISHPKHGHQVRGPATGMDSCKSQTGRSNSIPYTSTMYFRNGKLIPKRQPNRNTRHATLNAPLNSSDAPQYLLPSSGQASSASNACNPSATVDDNNPSFDKKNFKAIAVVQPLEQECCLKDAGKNNSCDAVDASPDKSAFERQSKTSETQKDQSSCKFSGVQASSVTTVPWTIETLTKLIEDNERAQQKEVMGLTKVNVLQPNCTGSVVEFNQRKHDLYTMMKTSAEFCRRYVTKDSVILTEAKGSYGENYCILKQGELYSEPPYISQWLNVGELDDIDREFGFALCLKNYVKKQSHQASEVTSIPAQTVKDDCVKDVTVIEPESTDPGQEKRIPNSPERRSSPKDDSSVDFSDSEFSFEINVLPPDEAKAIYEQIQKIEETSPIDKLPENDTGSSDQGKLSWGENATGSDKRAQVSHKEYCCLARFFSTFLKDDSSDRKCLCESANVPLDKTGKNNSQEKETSLAEGGNKEMDDTQPCQDSDMAHIEKDTTDSHNPLLLHLLLHEESDVDLSRYFDKMQSNAKESCTDAASGSKNTCCDTELNLKDTTSDSLEGTEAQSSFSKMPLGQGLPTEVKRRHCEMEHFHPTLKASKKCSNQVNGKPPGTNSLEVVVDLTEDEPLPSGEVSANVGRLLPCQGKDGDGSSDVEIQVDAKADDMDLISDGEQTCDTTLDSVAETEAQSPTSELATARACSPEMNTCSLPNDVKPLSAESPKIPVHLERESVPLKEKVVKLRLFGSECLQKMAVIKRPPKVISVHLGSLKESPSKPISMQEQSAKQRVYDKWKTSIVPVLSVSKRKDGTRKGSSILGVDRNRTAFVGNKQTESWICKRKRNEMIGLKLKRRKLSSAAQPVKWKGDRAAAAKSRDTAAVPLQENDDRRFRIPTTF